MPTRLLMAALVALALGGCGTSDDRAQVRSVVERFYDAVRHDDAQTACELLGDDTLEQLESQSQQACEDVITDLDYDGGAVVEAHVYITNATVALRNEERAFLSRESDGWKLSAIACKSLKRLPRDRPFDCEVEA